MSFFQRTLRMKVLFFSTLVAIICGRYSVYALIFLKPSHESLKTSLASSCALFQVMPFRNSLLKYLVF